MFPRCFLNGAKGSNRILDTPSRTMLLCMNPHFLQVSSDGVYTKQGNPKVLYSTMMVVRLKIVQESWQSLARALVTGIRYSAIRKQGPMDRGWVGNRLNKYHTEVPTEALNTLQGIVLNALIRGAKNSLFIFSREIILCVLPMHLD